MTGYLDLLKAESRMVIRTSWRGIGVVKVQPWVMLMPSTKGLFQTSTGKREWVELKVALSTLNSWTYSLHTDNHLAVLVHTSWCWKSHRIVSLPNRYYGSLQWSSGSLDGPLGERPRRVTDGIDQTRGAFRWIDKIHFVSNRSSVCCAWGCIHDIFPVMLESVFEFGKGKS